VDPDGRNINANCGALHPETMSHAVVEKGAAIGFALDGDADRVIISDERGRVVDGDKVMALCARRMMAEGTLVKKTLVTTVMSNLGLERAIDGLGGHLVRTPVGDRYVVEEMRKHGYNFGGEQSGHLVFLDHATTGDGIVAALQVLTAMAEEGKPLSELADAAMVQYPQILVNIKVKQRLPLAEMPAVTRRIEEVERKLGREGRVLVRYSGTELKCRVMIEGKDQAEVEAYAQDIAREIEKTCG
jgi:phosphoglucosamine mutase